MINYDTPDDLAVAVWNMHSVFDMRILVSTLFHPNIYPHLIDPQRNITEKFLRAYIPVPDCSIEYLQQAIPKLNSKHVYVNNNSVIHYINVFSSICYSEAKEDLTVVLNPVIAGLHGALLVKQYDQYEKAFLSLTLPGSQMLLNLLLKMRYNKIATLELNTTQVKTFFSPLYIPKGDYIKDYSIEVKGVIDFPFGLHYELEGKNNCKVTLQLSL